MYDFLKFAGGFWVDCGRQSGLGKLFLGQSISIDENNIFHSSIKTVGATVLGGLWALEWEAQESACQIGYKNQITLQFSEHLVQGMKIFNSTTCNKETSTAGSAKNIGSTESIFPTKGLAQIASFLTYPHKSPDCQSQLHRFELPHRHKTARLTQHQRRLKRRSHLVLSKN